MRILCAIFLTFLFANSAGAQLAELNKLTGNTVFMAIQCDVGRFGVDAKKAGIDPNMKAHVIYSWEIEQSQKVQLSFGAQIVKWIAEGPKVEASRTWTQTGKDSLEGPFNINQENRQACGRKYKPLVPVGIYDCLRDDTMPIKAGITAKCDNTRVAAGKLTADAKIKWLIFEVGPEGDFDVKVTYTMHVDAPFKDEKQKEEKKGAMLQ